jgi:hypothetical protein
MRHAFSTQCRRDLGETRMHSIETADLLVFGMRIIGLLLLGPLLAATVGHTIRRVACPGLSARRRRSIYTLMGLSLPSGHPPRLPPCRSTVAPYPDHANPCLAYGIPASNHVTSEAHWLQVVASRMRDRAVIVSTGHLNRARLTADISALGRFARLAAECGKKGVVTK